MDKETLSNYGWIVILVLILAVLIALATPFGNFIAGAFKATYAGFGMVGDNALGIVIPGSGGGEENGVQTPGIKFYQPYRYTMTEDGDESIMEYVFHENGAVDMYMFYYGADGSVEKYGESIPEGTCTYEENGIYVGGELAFTIAPDGSSINVPDMGAFNWIPTTVKYIQYGETYVNDWIVEEDYPHMIFAEDGSAKYYGDGGAQNFPAGTFIYKDRHIEFSGERCAIYPDGSKIIVGDVLLEIGCPHINTEIRNESETYTGDEYCADCGKLLNKGEVPPCQHPNTEIRNATEEYSGDTYCKDCGELIESGESLLIVFYIDKYTYSDAESMRYALPGMTWEEWLNSKYAVDYKTSFMINNDYWDGTWLDYDNADGLEKMMSLMFQQDNGTVDVWTEYLAYNEYITDDCLWRDAVLCDDVIIEGYHYNAWPYK